MPIKMGGKTFEKFDEAVKSVKQRRKGKKVRNPRAYVAAVEQMQQRRGKK